MKLTINIILALLIAFLVSGCKSFVPQKLNVSTVYSFEKRYDQKEAANIKINGNPIMINNDEVVWIVTGKTMFNLLTAAAGKDIDEITNNP